MTPKWKRKVLAKLDELGKSIPWMAEQIGMSRSAGYKIFAENADGSMVLNGCAEVPQICRLLGLDPPMIETPEPLDAKILELATVAPVSIKNAVIEILSSGKKPDDPS